MPRKKSIKNTLESETDAFIQEMPFWLKFLSTKIMEDGNLQEEDYEDALIYLGEDLEIYEKSGRPEIEINQDNYKAQIYYKQAKLKKLEHQSGANAIKKNMIIEFHPKLTVLFGENGAGKSSYSRLLKWAFFSRSEEAILSDVFMDEKEPLQAKFYFETDEGEIELRLPTEEEYSISHQFSVFDSKAVIKHLDDRNEFEFKPAGLVFFSELNDAINEVEKLAVDWIDDLTPINAFVDLFDGESEIKNLVEIIEFENDIIEKLSVHVPFSKKDNSRLKLLTKEHDELLISTNQIKSTIKHYQHIILDIKRNEKKIETLNSKLAVDVLKNVKKIISDFIRFEKKTRKEGLESFKSEAFDNIGSKEWREFIQASQEYAISEDEEYPLDNDYCIYCHQNLSKEATSLIEKYWIYLDSEAENLFRNAQSKLKKMKTDLKLLSFELFPEDSRLKEWLVDNESKYLNTMTSQLKCLAILRDDIIKNIDKKDPTLLKSIQINSSKHRKICEILEAKIKVLMEGSQMEKLNEIKLKMKYLNHKEKLNLHFKKIKLFADNRIIASILEKVKWKKYKRRTTDCEKDLSSRYFSADYIERFNSEVEGLNGKTQIEVNSRGAAAKSNRKLMIKGNSPSTVLSESEQKVVAISDFLVEMGLSDVTKGVFFDDPSTTLDDYRKSVLATRLVKEAEKKQVVIFTHDLAFLSSIIESSKDCNIDFRCHWIERTGGETGLVYLDNTPSFEKVFKTTGKAQGWYDKAKTQGPENRENSIRSGFASLRTSYEALVVFELFGGVVQRFTERVSVDSLSSVKFNEEIRDLVTTGFAQCCRYMEGHSHSDKYASKKPTLDALKEEILRFNKTKKSIKEIAKK